MLLCLQPVKMIVCLLSRSLLMTTADTASRRLLGPCGPWLSFRTSTSKLDSVVSYEQLKNMLSRHNIQLFDVRNPDEFFAGQIPGSVNIPLGQLEESLKLSPEHFKLLYDVKAPQKDDDNIVFHCQKGNRSSKALDLARHLGFTRARHFKGGYSEWTEHEEK